MESGHTPVSPEPGSFGSRRQRGTDHHRVRPTGDGFGDVPAGAHAPVGDHMDIATGLVEVTDSRRGCVTDQRLPEERRVPSTPRVVQAAPGPTPTRIPAAPVRMRWIAPA